MTDLLAAPSVTPEVFEWLPDDEAAAVLARRFRTALKLGHDVVSSIMLACRVDVAVATGASPGFHA
jgi:hypothetical protein